MRLLRRYHVFGASVFVLEIAAFALTQHLKGGLTIPLMDSMAASANAVRSADTAPLSFPAVAAPAAPPAETPSAPAQAGDQLLDEVHLSAGDAATRPADPSAADPLRIGFALGAASSVRVALSADDGTEVATMLENPSAPAGARVVEWSGANSAGSPVPGGRYTLTVQASQDNDVYSLSLHQQHVYIARPR